MASTVARSKVLELVQKMFQQRVSGGGFDRLLDKVTITGAENGILTAVMRVDKEHTNVGGTLHGAMTTHLVDSLSGLTLATCPDAKNTGVSLNLSMTFIKGAAVGDELEIVSRVDKAGGKIAYLSVDISNKNTGELIAKGSHTKYVAIANRPGSDIPR